MGVYVLGWSLKKCFDRFEALLNSDEFWSQWEFKLSFELLQVYRSQFSTIYGNLIPSATVTIFTKSWTVYVKYKSMFGHN